MSNLVDRLKRAAQATRQANAPGRFAQNGHPVMCLQCGHDQFDISQAQLNTAGMSLLGLDWTNPSATILVCKHCSRIEWYKNSPERR